MTKEDQKTAKVIAKIAKLFRDFNLSDQDATTLLMSAVINVSGKDASGKIKILSKQ